MSASGEVIDLRSPESKAGVEDEVEFVATIHPGNPVDLAVAAETEALEKKSNKRLIAHNDLVDQGNSKRQQLASSTNFTFENSSETAQRFDTGKLVPVVIDNDGRDDAVILPGYLDPKTRGSTREIIQHVRQNDKWSCGYRNLQMLLSAMLPQLPADHSFYQKYPHRLGQITIPSLQQVQLSLESAWREGFDPRGAAHYNHKLSGKREWIGALEVLAVLSYWGIDSTVIQFIRTRQSREMLPLFVREYFSKQLGKGACPYCSRENALDPNVAPFMDSAYQHAQQLLDTLSCHVVIPRPNPVCECPLLPLYLQWEGHSVTVVDTDLPECLLVFDPLERTSPTRLPVADIIKKDTQILMMTSFGMLTKAECNARKLVDESTFVATATMAAAARPPNKTSRK